VEEVQPSRGDASERERRINEIECRVHERANIWMSLTERRSERLHSDPPRRFLQGETFPSIFQVHYPRSNNHFGHDRAREIHFRDSPEQLPMPLLDLDLARQLIREARWQRARKRETEGIEPRPIARFPLLLPLDYDVIHGPQDSADELAVS
jgi:hypothetical protein